MHTKFFRLIVMVVIVCILTSCRSATPTPLSGLAKIRPYYVAAGKIYTDMVKRETAISTDYQAWEEFYSQMLVGAGDQLTIANQCFTNTENAVAGMAAAVFGQDAQGNPVSAAQENQAFVNALGTGGSLYAGNVDKCQQVALDLAQYIRVNREAGYNKRVKVIDMLRSYDLAQVETVEMAAMMRFYNQYGPSVAEFAQYWEQKLVDQIAAEEGLTTLPYDFIGFPTGALKVQVGNQKICDKYNEIYTGVIPVSSGRNKALYQVEMNTMGGCTLMRRAAYEYMNRLFVSKQAGTRLDCGIDAGIGEVIDENCNIVTVTPPAP